MKANECYCVKCRHACAPEGVYYERDRRGRARQVGQCPHCGTNVYKYISEGGSSGARSPRRSPKRKPRRAAIAYY